MVGWKSPKLREFGMLLLLLLSSLSVVPEGVTAPFVSASVVITWTPPVSPNGVILRYLVERRDQEGTLVTIGTLPGSELALILGDQTTTPFTEYSYRVVAENSVGARVSPFTAFLTPEAGNCEIVL